MHIWAEYKRFFREFRRDFHHTGAILPSGAFVAKALARPVAAGQQRQPLRILEVGPGTGSVTRAIARRMQLGDRLDAVEINPHFVEALRERVRREDVFAPHRDHIEIINAPLQELPGESVYDVIISGLPLNNFDPADVRSILDAYTRLVRPGGTLAYFEYLLIRQLKSPFVGRRERQRLSGVGRLVDQYIRAHQVRCERIYLNVPPAVVRQLRPKPAPCEGRPDLVSCPGS